MRQIQFLLGLLVLLTVSCSKSKNDEPTTILLPPSQTELIAKEYGINITGVNNLKTGVFQDDTTKILLYGDKDGKLWLNIGDKLLKKSILSWLDPNLLDTVLVQDLGYGNIQRTTLTETGLSSIYNNGNMSFVLSRSYVSGFGFRQSQYRYFFKNHSFSKRIIPILGTYNSFSPVVWYNRSILYKEKDVNNYDTTYTVYDNDGLVVTTFNFNNQGYGNNGPGNNRAMLTLEPISKNVFPIAYNEVIQLDDPFFRKWNYNTTKEIWRTEKAIASQVSTTLRIDSKKVSKSGDILTITCNYTLLSGEKGLFSYTVNIATGEVTKT